MRMNNCPRTQNKKIAKTGFKDPGSNLGSCEIMDLRFPLWEMDIQFLVFLGYWTVTEA